KAISEMDKVTQANAAGAEESAAASEELSTQAEQMKGAITELMQLVGAASAQLAESQGAGPRAVTPRTGGITPSGKTRITIPQPVAANPARKAA
ncbi:MAG: hypothetical protein ACM359_19540, partial [Bacillota bacterium]